MTHEYTIPFEVPADTAYEAIIKATELLRTGVRVERVVRVGPTGPGWYECVLDVSEGEHGSLGLGSPWTRGLFPDRDEVEATIPAGFRIDVTAVAGKPGPWRVRAVSTTKNDADGRPLELTPWTLTRDPRGAVAALASALVS
jgi:hypothetical protein